MPQPNSTVVCPEHCPFDPDNLLSDPVYLSRLLNVGTYCISFLSDPRVREGHCLIVPRYHAETVNDLHDRVVVEMFHEEQRLAALLREAIAPGTDIWQKHQPTLPDGGRVKVAHLHKHIIPRGKDDPLFPLENEHNLFEKLENNERVRLVDLLRTEATQRIVEAKLKLDQ